MLYNDKNAYKKYADRHAPRSPLLKSCVAAFWVGGLICTAGELMYRGFLGLDLGEDNARLLVTTTLVFLSALLTGIGLFDRIARYAGGGTLVPVTGFANSIASEALDTKSEGLVLGVGAKIFTVAGPVLLYGILSGALYGVIYYLLGMWGVV